MSERCCLLCGVYLTGHGHCPVTVWCPHCAAEPGDRCVKPDGSVMPIGSHARRSNEVRRVVVQPEREQGRNRRSSPSYSTDGRPLTPVDDASAGHGLGAPRERMTP